MMEKVKIAKLNRLLKLEEKIRILQIQKTQLIGDIKRDAKWGADTKVMIYNVSGKFKGYGTVINAFYTKNNNQAVIDYNIKGIDKIVYKRKEGDYLTKLM